MHAFVSKFNLLLQQQQHMRSNKEEEEEEREHEKMWFTLTAIRTDCRYYGFEDDMTMA